MKNSTHSFSNLLKNLKCLLNKRKITEEANHISPVRNTGSYQ